MYFLVLSIMFSESRQAGRGHRLHRCQSAFSLLEMLAVFSILALLVGMLLPSLKRSIVIANSTVCKHNLREIGYALRFYRYDNNGWLPAFSKDRRRNPFRRPDPANKAWFAKLAPEYLPDPMILTCPEDPFRYRMARYGSLLHRPEVSEFSSYGINSLISDGGGGYLRNLDRMQPTRPVDTFLIADAGPDQLIREGPTKYRFKYPRKPDDLAEEIVFEGPERNGSKLGLGDLLDPLNQRTSSPWLTNRHSGKTNFLTIAGNVREAETKDIMDEPVRRFYTSDARGGCTICLHAPTYHYSFARSQLFWWTGALPKRVTP